MSLTNNFKSNNTYITEVYNTCFYRQFLASRIAFTVYTSKIIISTPNVSHNYYFYTTHS